MVQDSFTDRSKPYLTRIRTTYISSRWPHGLRRGSAAGRLLGMGVRILPGAWMSVSWNCCVSGREVSATGRSFVHRSPAECLWFWSWCPDNEKAWARGLSSHKKKEPRTWLWRLEKRSDEQFLAILYAGKQTWWSSYEAGEVHERVGWFCHLAPVAWTRYYNSSVVPRRKKVACVRACVCVCVFLCVYVCLHYPNNSLGAWGRSQINTTHLIDRPRHPLYLPPLSVSVGRKQKNIKWKVKGGKHWLF